MNSAGYDIIRMDAADLGGRQDHSVRLMLVCMNSAPRPGQLGQVRRGCVLLLRHHVPPVCADRGADHSAMSGNVDAHRHCPFPLATGSQSRALRSKSVRAGSSRSSATISAHISWAVISGVQPSLFCALVGSPEQCLDLCRAEIARIDADDHIARLTQARIAR